MRICIPTGIFPPDIGGPATYVPAIGAALAERGHQVSVVTLSDVESAGDGRYRFPVHRIRRAQPRWRRMPLTARAIAHRARRADLVYANGLFIESAWAAWVTRKPLVIKIVGDWAWERAVGKGWLMDTIEQFQRRRYGPRVEALKALRALVTDRADLVLTPSRYLRHIVAGWGIDADRLHVIYNAGQPLPAPEPAPLPPFEGSTVVTVGRLVPWKGVDRLLRVVAGLPQVRLLIVGDGPERESLESLASGLDLGRRVIFTGQVSKEQVPGYLCAADVFVLNSTYEGLPHIVLEAMQAGVPVVATDVGGTGELVQHGANGLLIRPGDDAGLRAALEQISTCPEKRVGLVEGGHRTLAADFSFDKMVLHTEALLTGASAADRGPARLPEVR